ncbi:MAG: hypothetical protein HYX69_01360 [Planctomycetia bacterium]|nr:hypothetical protein [Planctomycetia bacterium]
MAALLAFSKESWDSVRWIHLAVAFGYAIAASTATAADPKTLAGQVQIRRDAAKIVERIKDDARKDFTIKVFGHAGHAIRVPPPKEAKMPFGRPAGGYPASSAAGCTRSGCSSSRRQWTCRGQIT